MPEAAPPPQTAASAPATVPRDGRLRLVAFVLSAVLVALPFLAVTFPPITDLPQQAAQIRLAADALTSPDSVYKIQWFTPYTLSYLPIAAGWLVGGPLAAGRLGMLLIALLWVGAAHLLAWRRRRPAAAAVLACTLIFNSILYWGFYSFAVGWPLFVIWLLVTLRDPESRTARREAATFLLLGVVLYMGHALWLAAGALWLGVWSLAHARRWRAALPRFVGLAPVLIVSAVWFAGLTRTNFATAPLYFRSPLTRLSLHWLQGALYGGIRGRFEALSILVLLAWFLLSLLTNGGRLGAAADRPLALAGALFALIALCVPDEYTNTIQLDERWMPGAMTLLLLASPPPRLRKGALTAGALAALLLFTTVTAAVWRRFERDDLSGLPAALAALPEKPRVLGIALDRTSPRIEGLPFLQTFAYAQLVHGGVLNFSFAEFAPSLVVYRRPPSKPWTPNLEWLPRRLRISDFRWFDFLLVGADAAEQARFAADPILAPVTADGRWRLYRIDPAKVAAALAERGLTPASPAAPAPGSPAAPPSPDR